MDENFAWKIVYAATIFSLFILGLAYYLISPRESTFFNSEKIERTAEFKNTKVEGRKDGKPAWEFFARAGWSEKDQANTYLSQVKNGKIFSDGKINVKNLTAPQVKVNRNADLIEASGGVAMQTKEGKLFTDRVSFYRTEKRAVMADKIRIVRSNGIAQTGTAEYLSEPEQLNANNGIKLALKEGKIKTRVKADRAILYMDINKDIPLTGSLEVTQGRKMAVANEGTYSRKQNGLLLKGKTRTIMEKGAALLREGTANKMRSPDVKEILKDKTIVTSDTIFFSTKTGDANAGGSVEVTQKGREARSDSAVYDDQSERLTLSGNVFMKKNEDWISCRQVVISVNKETFEAIGVKEAKFKI